LDRNHQGVIKSIDREHKAMVGYELHPTDSGVEINGEHGAGAGAGTDTAGAGASASGCAGPDVTELYKPKKEMRPLFDKVGGLEQLLRRYLVVLGSQV
jgi:hypothetical protein